MRVLSSVWAWLCGATLLRAQVSPDWVDPSPHQRRLVPIDGDGRVELLNWGGTGPPARAPGSSRLHRPHLRRLGVEVTRGCEELLAWSIRHLEDGKSQLKAIGANVEVIELPSATPFVFLTHGDEVRQAIVRYAVQ